MNIQVQRKPPRLEITNAVDIMFFMLIFFILFSTLRHGQAGIDVNLPQAVSGKAMQVQDFVISVDDNKELYWGNQPLAIGELGPKIESQLRKNPNSRFIVQADRNLRYYDLVKVLDKARLAGGTKVALAVQPAESRN